MKIIDPTHLNDQSKKLLMELIEQQLKDEIFIGAQPYAVKINNKTTVEFYLKYPLLKCTSKHDKNKIKYEILNAYCSGGFAKLFENKSVLKEKNILEFKQRVPDKYRIFKRLGLVTTTREQIESEWKKTNKYSDQIECKEPLFNNDYGFLQLPKLKGMDLYDFIQFHGEHSSFVALLTISRNIVRAVHAMHNKKAVHRDIKPENIMIDPETLSIKLIDFDMAIRPKEYQGGIIVGTETYVAPEYEYKEQLGYRSDWYSVGWTLAKLFGERKLKSLDYLFTNRDIPDDFKPEIRDLLKQLLQNDPTMRIGYRRSIQIINNLITRAEQSNCVGAVHHAQ